MAYLILWDLSAADLPPEWRRSQDTFLETIRAEGILQARISRIADLKQVVYIIVAGTLSEAKGVARRDPLGNVDGATFTATPLSTETPPSRRFDPIFPVTNMQRSLEHYRQLGFSTEQSYDEYAFVTWPGVGKIHLNLQSESEYDPKVAAAATYLYVDDADALAARWQNDCKTGETREVVATDYGLREGAHMDPDNNLIRFGSKVSS